MDPGVSCVGQSVLWAAGRETLGRGLDIWYGFKQSVASTQQGPALVMDMAAGAFVRPGPALALLAQARAGSLPSF